MKRNPSQGTTVGGQEEMGASYSKEVSGQRWEKTVTVKHWESLKREATGSIKNFSGQQFEQRDARCPCF